jgi:hypothetical protein
MTWDQQKRVFQPFNSPYVTVWRTIMLARDKVIVEFVWRVLG